MPKGKPKAKYSHLYADEDTEEANRRKTAPQAAPHRRGGTHRVREEDATGTIWDNLNYDELVQAAKHRGVWFKDARKAQLMKALAAYDQKAEIERQTAEREQEQRRAKARKRVEMAKQEQERKERERIEREQRKAVGEEVSDSEHEVSDIDDWGGDEPLATHYPSDSPTSSSTTETSIKSTNSPIFPCNMLRLFKWPGNGMPSSKPPPSPLSLRDRRPYSVTREYEPIIQTYTLLKLVTTMTKETVELPGRDYPEDVEPDFVPVLSQHTKDCARNGILIGTLRRAVIEKAANWAKCTQVQWWNGRMYFHLQPKTSTVALGDVYRKWDRKKMQDKVNRKVERSKNNRVTKPIQDNRLNKREQKKKDDRAKWLDIWATSEYRPPMCFLPAYLDGTVNEDDPEIPLTPDNLFYIRFPSMDLPHYYFWVLPGEWEDPSTPNPDWEVHKAQDREDQQKMYLRRGQVFQTHTHMRVKKPNVPRKFRPDQQPPKTSKYKAAVWKYERELYQDGLQKTLYRCRSQWLSNDKEWDWEDFSADLPTLYPSGKMPDAPPIKPAAVQCIAEKLASIEVPSHHRLVPSFRGDEPWTRDDEAYWDIVEIPSEPAPAAKEEGDVPQELCRSGSIAEPSQALHRRSSEGFFNWLQSISPTFPSTPDTPGPSVNNHLRAVERAQWEEAFARHAEPLDFPSTSRSTVSEIAPFMVDMAVEELKFGIFAIKERTVGEQHDQCAICLKPLEEGTSDDALKKHYQEHHNQSDSTCPFCDMPWGGLNPSWKASHIFSHGVKEEPLPQSSVPNDYPLYSIPSERKSSLRSSQKPSVKHGLFRRTSKVHFANFTVEKRIAYNDEDWPDAAVDDDLGSLTPLSPKKKPSSLKKSGTLKPALRVDTSSNHRSKASKRKRSTSMDGPPNKKARGHSKRRQSTDGDDAAWDPRQYSSSGSEHIPSPHLPCVRKLPLHHPDANWNPSYSKKMTSDSLEQSAKKKKKGAKRKTRSKIVKVKGSIQKPSGLQEAGANVKEKAENKSKRQDQKKDSKTEYENMTTEAIRSAPRSVVLKKRKRVVDPTYRDEYVSSSSSAPSPTPPKRRRHIDPTFRPEAEQSSESSVEPPPKKRKATAPRIKLGESPKLLQNLAPYDDDNGHSSDEGNTSNMSNASSDSVDMRARGLVKKEGLVNGLTRRFSSQVTSDDFLLLPQDIFEEDHEEDVLTGNPFSTPKGSRVPKRDGKHKNKAARNKIRSSIPTPKEIALAAKKDTVAADLASRQTSRHHALSLNSDPPSPPEFPATASPTEKSVSFDISLERALRSSAPTPSPSLADLAYRTTTARRTSSKSTVAPISPPSQSLYNKYPPWSTSLSEVDPTSLRKPSFDVACSQPSPIVPPNTPPHSLAQNRRSSRGSVLSIEEKMRPDAGELSDKIGSVQTTRTGMVRNLSVCGRRMSMSKKAKGVVKAARKSEKVVKNEKQEEKKTVVRKKGIKVPVCKVAKKAKGGKTNKERVKAKRKRSTELELLLADLSGRKGVKR